MAVSGSMVGVLAGLLQMLPLLFSVLQAVVYVVAILFFGSIAIRGYRGYLAWHKRLLMRLALGGICVVTGIAIAPFLGMDNPLLKLVQLDLWIGMLVSSIVLLISTRLMTLNVPYSVVLKERIRRLQEKLERRKDKDKNMPENRLKHPATIAGLAIFIVFIGLSLLNFRGFPDMRQSMFSALGLSESDMTRMNEALGQFMSSPFANLSTECMATLQEIQGRGELKETVYENAAMKAMIESSAGGTVSEMYKMESGGKVMVIAAMSSGKRCFATPTEFCICS